MQIYLAVSGQRQGPYSLEEVNRAIDTEQVPLEGTQAWWEGCSEWRSLASVPGIITRGREGSASPSASPGAPSIPPFGPAAPPVSPATPLVPPSVGDATGGVIPYKNPAALTSYYLGIVSLLPVLGFFFGIAAVMLGVRGLRKRRAEPHVKGSIHAWIGIVLGSLSMLVHVLVTVVIIIAMSSSAR